MLRVQYVLKYCNACAHSLAKFALKRNTSTIWLEKIPTEVQNVHECWMNDEKLTFLLKKKKTLS